MKFKHAKAISIIVRFHARMHEFCLGPSICEILEKDKNQWQFII
jgi:hypothetical protein